MKLVVILLSLFCICCSANTTASNMPNSKPIPQCQYTWFTHDQQYIDAVIKEKQSTATYQTNLVQFIANKIINTFKRVKSEHVIQLFDSFLFEEKEMLETIKAIAIRLHPMNACEIITLINLFEDQEKQFTAFKLIYHSLMIPTDEQKNKILGQLAECYRTEAYELLSNMNQFNCLFGTLQGNVIAFVIDANQRMGELMSKDPEYTFFDYVKSQLKETILTQLKPGMKFNIFASYFNSVKKWQIDFKDVTQRSLNSALQFIDDIKVELHPYQNLYGLGIAPSLVTQYKIDTIAFVSHQVNVCKIYHTGCSDFYSWFYKQGYPYQLNYYIFQ